MIIVALSVLNCAEHVQGSSSLCSYCTCSHELSEDKTQCLPRPTTDQNACLAIYLCTQCRADNPNFCAACFDGYSPSADGCSCVLKDNACKAFSNVQLTCWQCGYTTGLFEKKCYTCQVGCTNCTFVNVSGKMVETCLDCCVADRKYTFTDLELNFSFTCPSNANYTLQNGKCVNCAQQELFGIDCLSCSQNKCTLCARSNQFINANGKCENCPQYCLKCSQSGCSSCQSTADGFPVFMESGVCFTCNNTEKYGAKCATCGLSACKTCSSTGYSVIGGKCQKCPDMCLTCSATNVCTSCSLGYPPKDGACYDCGLAKYGQNCGRCDASACLQCNSTANQTVIDGKCTHCETGCSECTGDTCTLCTTGYSLYMGKCYNCQLTSQYGSYCTLCDGVRCLNCSSNKANYFLGDGKCQQCPATCATCESSTKCKSCISGSRISFVNGMCYDCAQLSYGTNCATCDASQCKSCLSGYAFGIVGGKCTACSTNCIKCDDRGCLNCSTSYNYLALVDYQCINCTKFGTYCRNCTKEVCTSCMQSGYNIDASGKCVQCPSNCLNCTLDQCTLCKTGYYLMNGTCRQCNSNCSACTASECTNCKYGYTLANKSCILCQEAFGSQCTSCSLSACLACNGENSGFNLISGRCKNCSEHGECLKCNASGCKTCKPGYFAEAGTCKNCIPNCLICSNTTTCDHCDPEFYQSGNQCYNCSESKYGENCLSCNATQCLSCKTGSDYYTYSIYKGVCRRCNRYCESCNTSLCDSCYSAQSYFSKDGDNCYNCSNSQYGSFCAECNRENCTKCRFSNYNTLDGKCQQCPINCLTCKEGKCLTCIEDYHKSNGTCKTCQQLFGSNCRNCTDTTCTDCLNQWYGFSIVESGECLDCSKFHSHCQACTQSKCTWCPRGYWEENSGCERCPTGCNYCENGKCVEFPPWWGNCTNCTYDPCANSDYAPINGVCQNCSSHFGPECVRCTSQGCTKCDSRLNDTHFVYNGICYDCTNQSKYGVQCGLCNGNKCIRCKYQNGYYLTTEGKCATCGANCASCTQDGCTTCSSLDKTMYKEGLSCKMCLAPCVTCTNATTCLTCTDNHYFQEGQCIACSELTNCQSCTTDGKCTKCSNEGAGVSLTAGTCVDCKAKFGNGCRACDLGKCKVCANGSFINTAGVCKECTTGCELCQLKNGIEACTRCAKENQGVSIINGQCVSCSNHDFGVNCMACNTTSCTLCTLANHTIYENGTCNLCSLFCKSCNGSDCLACQDGYFSLVGSERRFCVNCSQYGDSCSSCTDGSCLTCSGLSEYVGADGHCHNCSASCKTCSSTATKCGSCYNEGNGTSLNGDVCVNCKSLFGDCKNCSATSCLECAQENYYIASNGRCVACQQNCKNCTHEGCVSCYNEGNGISLADKTCYDCSQAMYGSGCKTCDATKCLSCGPTNHFLNSGRCQPCASMCSSCTSESSCQKCEQENNGVSLVSGRCVSCAVYGDCLTCDSKKCLTCRGANQYIDQDGVCQTCLNLCARCSDLYNCSQCASVSGKIISLHQGVCHVCSKNCKACESSSVCTLCDAGYIPVLGVCQKCGSSCAQCEQTIERCTSCASGYVQNATDYKCYACSQISNCNACEVIENKLRCKAGQCKSGYQQTEQEEYAEQCVKCPENCDYCISSTRCGTCKSGFGVGPEGNCTSCSDVANCQACEYNADKKAMVCSLNGCNSGYHAQDGVCVVCQAANCLQCVQDQPYQCAKCSGDALIPYNQVCSPCESVIPNCLRCEIENSIYKCKTCAANFNLSTDRRRCGSCSGILNCRKCDLANPNLCSLCENSYKLENEGQECNAWQGSECDFYNADSMLCMRCIPNMHLIQTVCYSCKQKACLRCSSDLTTCLECVDNSSYTLGSDGVCRSNCDDSHCIECSGNLSHCEQCDVGYQTLLGQCVPCTPNCEKCDESADICQACAGDALLSPDGKCGACDGLYPGCATCVESSGYYVCSACTAPLVLVPNGAGCTDACMSVQNCGECDNGSCVACQFPYVLSSDGLLCESAKNDCKEFDDQSIACTECDAGFYLDGRVCRPCADKYEGCAVCDTEKCSECLEDLQLASNGQFCGSCLKIANCTGICDAIDPNRCSECADGFLPSIDGKSCLQCAEDPNCVACESAETCGACADGMKVYQGKYCVYDGCPPHCALCDASLACAMCEEGYLLANGVCEQDNCESKILGQCVACVGGYTLNGLSCEKQAKRASIDTLEIIAITTGSLGCVVAIGAVVGSLIQRQKAGKPQSQSSLSRHSESTAEFGAPESASLAQPPSTPVVPLPSAAPSAPKDISAAKPKAAQVRRVVKKKIVPKIELDPLTLGGI